MTEITFPGAFFTWPTGINDRGDIAGRYNLLPNDGIGNQGFILRKGEFTSIDFPGAAATIVSGLNRRGDAVGRYFLPGEAARGFLFSDGEYTSIEVDLPGVVATLAYGINARGDISGRYLDGPDGNVAHGFLLRKGKFTTFDFPGASRTFTR